MDESKLDELDDLLSRVFQEEALKIVPPSSLLMWDSLQQDINKYRRFKTWKKRLYQAGAAVACLLLVVIFINYSGEQKNSPGQGVSMQSASLDLGAMQSAPELGENMLSAAPSVVSGVTVEDAGAADADAAILMTDDYPEALSEAGIEELSWYDEGSFFNALAGLNSYSASVPVNVAIYYFPTLPDTYSFRLGTVKKDNHILLMLYQEYENENGKKLTFNQFFSAEGRNDVAVEAIEAARTMSSPYRANSLSGYLSGSQQGTTTLTWEEENCVFTLSGELDDIIIEDFLSNMAKID